MIGSGSIVLTHSNGWACAKEATMGVEFDIKPDKTAKRTMVVSIKGLFDVVGNANDVVNGIFKGDTGIFVSFEGQLLGKSKINITSELGNNFETILKDIKTWQSKYY